MKPYLRLKVLLGKHKRICADGLLIEEAYKQSHDDFDSDITRPEKGSRRIMPVSTAPIFNESRISISPKSSSVSACDLTTLQVESSSIHQNHDCSQMPQNPDPENHTQSPLHSSSHGSNLIDYYSNVHDSEGEWVLDDGTKYIREQGKESKNSSECQVLNGSQGF